MQINVLDEKLNRIAIVDDFTSLMWCKRYYDVGAIDLQIEANIKNIELFKPNNFITRDDDDAIYRIDAIEIDDKESDSLIVGGVDCKKILHQRIIWEKTVFAGTVEDYIRLLINKNIINPRLQIRNIDNFLLTEKKGFEDEITQQVTYDNLGEKIIEICKTYKYGSRVYLENKNFYFDLYKGQDKSLTFSNELDNLLSSKYNYDNIDFKNCALIAGEGEGDNRVTTNVGDATGLNRFEILVDDSESKDDLSDMEYLNKLKYKGYEELAKQGVKTKFECEVDHLNYKYKEDYNLGDVITIKNEYGITSKARITEVIETWDNTGYTIEPKLDYDEFEAPVTPTELIATLIATYSQDMSTELIFNKEDYPYGISIEVLGGKGSDGEGGKLNSYMDGRTIYSGEGGAGGKSGDDVNLNFIVDGIEYTATALGGGGGGGGCGLYNNIENVSYGGKGGQGQGLVLNLVFENSVKLQNISFVETSFNGEQPDRSGTYIRYLQYRYSPGGDSGMGDKAYQKDPYTPSNGADCITIRTGANTTYPDYVYTTTSDEVNHIVKIYKLERVF